MLWKGRPVAGHKSELASVHAARSGVTQHHCAMLVPAPAADAGCEKGETRATGICKRKLLKVQEIKITVNFCLFTETLSW